MLNIEEAAAAKLKAEEDAAKEKLDCFLVAGLLYFSASDLLRMGMGMTEVADEMEEDDMEDGQADEVFETPDKRLEHDRGRGCHTAFSVRPGRHPQVTSNAEVQQTRCYDPLEEHVQPLEEIANDALEDSEDDSSPEAGAVARHCFMLDEKFRTPDGHLVAAAELSIGASILDHRDNIRKVTWSEKLHQQYHLSGG